MTWIVSVGGANANSLIATMDPPAAVVSGGGTGASVVSVIAGVVWGADEVEVVVEPAVVQAARTTARENGMKRRIADSTVPPEGSVLTARLR